MKSLLAEASLVGLAGLAIALIANAVSPRRLELSRNYFPNRPVTLPVVSAASNALSTGVSSNAHLNPLEVVSARLKAQGLSLVDSNQVVQLYHDPRHALNQVVFVDARNDDHYQAGHIPGAFQLDYYRPAEYLPVLMPIAQTAEQIVIYCNGGTCEDSELAAGLLAQAVPKEKLLVYAGGFAEWLTNGLPVEVGARLSGRFKTNTPAL